MLSPDDQADHLEALAQLVGNAIKPELSFILIVYHTTGGGLASSACCGPEDMALREAMGFFKRNGGDPADYVADAL